MFRGETTGEQAVLAFAVSRLNCNSGLDVCGGGTGCKVGGDDGKGAGLAFYAEATG
jgi:hypothetical protein